jgi:hypothetical protein
MKCFVIMPFAAAFDDVFNVVKGVAASAVPDATFECYWLKDVHAAGRITDDILTGLKDAAFCIADVSGHNPNVMWETGYAMALGKPTILIGQDIATLPFDLTAHRVLAYSPVDMTDFQQKLAEAIRQTLSRYELKGVDIPELPSARRTEQRTVVVTGTMTADEATVYQRLQRVLTPYLSETTMWLIGSVGTVDLAAARFLLEHTQKVTAVGYHRFDCAPELRELIANARMGFVDASLEAIPRGMQGPSKRDALFCMKADLVVLLWDGQSSGTQCLIQYFQSQGVASLLIFL